MAPASDSMDFGAIKTIQLSFKARNGSIFDLVVVATLKNVGRRLFALNTAIASEEHQIDSSIIQSNASTITIKIQKAFEIQKLQFFCIQLSETPIDCDLLFNIDNKKTVTLPVRSMNVSDMGLLEFAQIEFKKITNTLSAARNVLTYSDFISIYIPKTLAPQASQQNEFAQQIAEQPAQRIEQLAQRVEQPAQRVEQLAQRQPQVAQQQYVQQPSQQVVEQNIEQEQQNSSADQQPNQIQLIQWTTEVINKAAIRFFNRLIPFENEYVQRRDFRYASRTGRIADKTHEFHAHTRPLYFLIDFVRPVHSLCELGFCVITPDGTEETYLSSRRLNSMYGALQKFPYCMLYNENRKIIVDNVERDVPAQQILINVGMFEDQVSEVILFATSSNAQTYWGLDGYAFRIVSDGPEIPVTYYPGPDLHSAILRFGSIQKIENSWIYVPNVRAATDFVELRSVRR